MVFFAIQCLGGVSVCVNAWLEEKALVHCLVLTEPKVRSSCCFLKEKEGKADGRTYVGGFCRSGTSDKGTSDPHFSPFEMSFDPRCLRVQTGRL